MDENDADGLAGIPLGEILTRISADADGLAAGSTAAISLAFAAGLVESVARTYLGEGSPASLVAQAETVRDRAIDVAGRNRVDYARARAALSGKTETDDLRLREALDSTLENLGWIAGHAADLTMLAAQLVGKVDPDREPDLESAVCLAESAARVSMKLADANLLNSPAMPLLDEIAEDLRIVVSTREKLDH